VNAATAAAPRSGAGDGGAGLVPYKTSLGDKLPMTVGAEFQVSFHPDELALNRIKRLKRAVWASGHLHKLAENGFRAPQCWFVTLTYARPDEWTAKHVSAAVQGFRKWCMRRKVACRYTWVAEIQPKRLESTGQAVVHYHLLAWLPVGLRMPQWDRPCEGRPAFWAHGMTNTQPAVAGIGYLMKYLGKLGQFHRFPKGLRLYGIGGLNSDGKAVRGWINLPEWAKARHGVGELVRRSGRLVVRATGEILCSPFRVSLVPGGCVVRVVGEVLARWFDGPYSSLAAARA
jgi:hypothetical protein